MSFNDPIAEFLTRIRNAQQAKQRYVELSISKIRIRIAEILKEEGFIANFLTNQEKRKMRIFLKYNSSRNSVIHGLKRVSSPGRRRYSSCQELPRVNNGLGIAVLSTSKGIMEAEKARKEQVGGEVLCYVW